MLGRGLLVGGRSSVVAFRSAAASAAAASTAISKPASIAVGDIAFIAQPDNGFTDQNVTTSSGSTWTRSQVIGPTSSQFNLFWKVLNATDVANAWNLTNNLVHGAYAAAYRPVSGFTPAAAAAKSTAVNLTGDISLALTGYTPAGANVGTVSAIISRNDSGTATTAPTGFTEDAKSDIDTVTYKIAFASHADYPPGSTATWTALSVPGIQTGWLIEVTR